MVNVQRIRVPVGFLFGLVFLYFCRPTPYPLGAGLLVAAGGLAVRIWSTGHLEKWRRLAVRGPYRFTRNPLYFGSFLMGLGFTLASSSFILLILFLLLFVLLYGPVMKREEKELLDQYGEDYLAYRERVSRFLPGRPLPIRGHEVAPFSWKRVWENREYNAILGYFIVSLFLCWKSPWPF